MRILVLFMFIVAFKTTVLAQGVDSLFKVARNYAFNGKPELARSICFDILKTSPDYSDVKLLIGRTYSWYGMRDSARYMFNDVLRKDSLNAEAWAALADVEYWDDKPETALFAANKGLEIDPKDQPLLVKKINALADLKRFEEAEVALRELKKLDTSLVLYKPLANKLYRLQAKSHFSVGASFDYFANNVYSEPFFHYQFVQWGFKAPKNTFIIRMNFNQRFGSSGAQPEIDWYKSLKRRMYLYINYGYTTFDLFPIHRVGLELHKNLPRSYEVSAGFRLLDFGPGSNVMIYTGSVTKYKGNYAFIARTFITPDDETNSFSRSLLISIRRYTLDEDNFLGIVTGAGYSPDQRTWQTSNNNNDGSRDKLLFLQAYRAGWIYSFTHNFKHLWTIEFDYRYQELPFNTSEFTHTIGMSLSYRIRY
ncbi:MAG: YaiO family outer membrane beta-barrel protein [Bacteroidia bacterium]|nr:YaiO family outer membrane beta-barrel protein [Bacteroidia bacterium]